MFFNFIFDSWGWFFIGLLLFQWAFNMKPAALSVFPGVIGLLIMMLSVFLIGDHIIKGVSITFH